MTPVQKMTSMVKCLPDKDRLLAAKFISERDFISLREIVDSLFIRIDKNQRKFNPSHKYDNVDLEILRDLSEVIDDYLVLLGEDLDNFTHYEEEDEEIKEDEF